MAATAAPMPRYVGFWIRVIDTPIDGAVLGIGVGATAAVPGPGSA